MVSRFGAVCLAAALSLLAASPAVAIDAYSDGTNQAFTDWCTGETSNTESVCSCALKSVATTVPAATLTSYLATTAQGGETTLGSLATVGAASTATAVTQALISCGGSG